MYPRKVGPGQDICYNWVIGMELRFLAQMYEKCHSVFSLPAEAYMASCSAKLSAPLLDYLEVAVQPGFHPPAPQHPGGGSVWKLFSHYLASEGCRGDVWVRFTSRGHKNMRA